MRAAVVFALAIGAAELVERGLVVWLEGRNIAMELLAGVDRDPAGAAALAVALGLRVALSFGAPVALAGVLVHSLVPPRLTGQRSPTPCPVERPRIGRAESAR